VPPATASLDQRRLEESVRAVATRLAELGAGGRAKLFRGTALSERMMDWAMSRPGFKTQLFRFVDTFPAMAGDDDVLRHVAEYFDGADVPRLLDFGVEVAEHVPFGESLTASVARRNITRMAEQFIVGRTPEEAAAGLEALWRRGSAHTVDLLGEKTVIEAEADRYAARVVELIEVLARRAASWAPDDHLERDDLGPLPRVNVSIKPTALATHLEPLSGEVGLAGAKARIRPILELAGRLGVHVNIDMEHADVKDLTLRLARELLTEPGLADVHAGVVVQAYLKDSRDDLAEVIGWSADREVPVTVRLVKGAYWDTETVHARAEGWPVPVYERKAESDANFERCIRLLHDHHGEVRAAFGSHNLRSLAYAVAYARERGIPDTGYELQMLHGMAEPVHGAVRRIGIRHRVYAPVGELVPGMAYLVRRLLENTSNESFVRHRFAEGQALDGLLAPPDVDGLPALAPLPPAPPTDPADPTPYQPEPLAEWRRPWARAPMAAAVAGACTEGAQRVPAIIDGSERWTADTIESLDPGDHSRIVAVSVSCGVDEADAAVAAAAKAQPCWAATPVRERARVLFGAAAWMRARRAELAALEVVEAGKPWDQADADVCEAIDFCEYYGREALRLDAGAADRVQSPPGEENRLRYQGKGVAVVISPWNFPLAIPAGMVAAALVAGNSVVLKPAEQTPAVARRLVDALVAAGAPAGTVGFLPGLGEVVGARLVEHPDTAVIAFTGSRPVGLGIVAAASTHQPGQRHIKRVVAELGGKNAVIVDTDADPDQAVPGVVVGAFGYAGQKCSATSRLIVVGDAYEPVLDRLAAATLELVVGHPSDPATTVGPLIDADAQDRLLAAAATAEHEGRVVARWAGTLPADGWYVPPLVVADVDPATSTLWRDELFGPLLCVVRAGDLDEALALANDTPYALTAGCWSRSPANLRRAAAELRAGNVYLNRSTTGAVVGRQPFGGYGLSGVGSKAGGPDYLLQFCDPRVVTENTVRQGFVPG
jgi:RHH-type proline utilization regulon transcriptional repressor/proline dehydrogenase/delta 1-pyrroline-5-carboxylate dehydrogenase